MRILLSVLTIIALNAPVPGASWHGLLTPCVTEDSSGCFWDAGDRGNGEGVSFVG